MIVLALLLLAGIGMIYLGAEGLVGGHPHGSLLQRR